VDFLFFPLLLPFLLVGHATLVVACHNWWYGRLIGRRLTDVVQLIHLALLLLMPLLWIQVLWANVQGLQSAGHWYGLISLAGFGLFVGVTLARRLRVLPAEVVDLGREDLNPQAILGHSGSGSGWRARLALVAGNDVLHPVLKRYELLLDSVDPALNGIKILHLSDLHFGKTPTREWYQAVMRMCGKESPDLLLFTGDLVDGLAQHDWIPSTLGHLSASIPSVGILGNHDTWYEPNIIERRLRQIGFQMAGSTVVKLLLRGIPIWVMGNELPWRGSPPVIPKGLDNQLLIALCHSPDEAIWAEQNGAKLIFSGHVHGGQVRIPLIGPVIMPSRYGRKYDSGWFRVGKAIMHVSCGLGGSQPIRWQCPPEVTMITLRVSGNDHSS
jgi:uncharacterized protein